ncbi:MAG: hypothetical protein MK052_04845 [Alphaproteobacteria bacterium]|nr:hypothetical protein [Alphaproteobacteria bacterium]
MNDLNLWQKKFSGIPPLGYLLRENFGSRWIRFHSLPESKRYAENDQEMSIILNRATILANEVLGTDQCSLFVSYPDYNNEQASNSKKAAKNIYNLDQSFSWQQADEDEALHWTTYWASTHWNTDAFSPLIKKIADDNEYPVVWLSNASLEVFAPYDGGFDIICKTPERISQLQEKYADWMSSRADRL